MSTGSGANQAAKMCLVPGLVFLFACYIIGTSWCTSIDNKPLTFVSDDAIVAWSMMNPQVEKLMDIKGRLQRLHRVTAGSKMRHSRQTVLQLLPPFVMNMFEAGDTDKDGKLTVEEFNNMYDGFDSDGDHEVDQEEYVTNFITNGYGTDRRIALALYRRGDFNRNSVLDYGDLNIVRGQFDFDGDGFVTEEEFKRKWQQVIKLVMTRSGRGDRHNFGLNTFGRHGRQTP